MQKPLEPREHPEIGKLQGVLPKSYTALHPHRPQDTPKWSFHSGKNVKDLKLPSNSDGFLLLLKSLTVVIIMKKK